MRLSSTSIFVPLGGSSLFETAFATLQPDNATGNFTKIVQRPPTKIVLAPNQPTARLLRVGLSVEATIETGLADVVATCR
jgi:membrane fusion protein, multidrug efflux system